MSQPLSLLSSASLNRISTSVPRLEAAISKSPSKCIDMDNHLTIAEPQTDFDATLDIDIELETPQPSRSYNSPLPTPKQAVSSKTSPSKSFVIHEDFDEAQSPRSQNQITDNADADSFTDAGTTGGDPSLNSEAKRLAGNDETKEKEGLATENTITLDTPGPTPLAMRVRHLHEEADDDDVRSNVSDDTCFSAFSAVPNADMTLFAALGNQTPTARMRSPSKFGAIDEVCTTR